MPPRDADESVKAMGLGQCATRTWLAGVALHVIAVEERWRGALAHKRPPTRQRVKPQSGHGGEQPPQRRRLPRPCRRATAARQQHGGRACRLRCPLAAHHRPLVPMPPPLLLLPSVSLNLKLADIWRGEVYRGQQLLGVVGLLLLQPGDRRLQTDSRPRPGWTTPATFSLSLQVEVKVSEVARACYRVVAVYTGGLYSSLRATAGPTWSSSGCRHNNYYRSHDDGVCERVGRLGVLRRCGSGAGAAAVIARTDIV